MINNKYNIGDEVFILGNHKIVRSLILSVAYHDHFLDAQGIYSKDSYYKIEKHLRDCAIVYSLITLDGRGDVTDREQQLIFKTKEDLLASL